jgi:hypothetical protein
MCCAVQAVIGRLKRSCKSVHKSTEVAFGLSYRHICLVNLVTIAYGQRVHQNAGLGRTVFYV